MSQTASIRQALLRGDRLTPMIALRKYGCFRLASRINEIRRELTVRSKLLRVGRKTVAQYYIA